MEKMIGTTNGTNGINDIINGEKKHMLLWKIQGYSMTIRYL